jgi:phosphatidylglycerol:prolipoprotein diacylglycerol transferase
MHQIIFHLPIVNLPIYGYGLMLVVAFLACVRVARWMAVPAGMDPEAFVNAALIALLAGIVGARLSHVIENIGTYTDPRRSGFDNFMDAINIRAGGLTFYGGVILATPCVIAYAVYKRMSLLRFMDISAVLLMVGLGFGRIGCYLNGCCYGELLPPGWGSNVDQFPYNSNPYIDQVNRELIQPPAELINQTPDGRIELKSWDQVRAEGLTALADRQHALAVQPTQLYSSLTAFMLAGLLWSYWTLEHLDGRVFALMLMLEGPSRFLLEMIRVEPAVIIGRFAGIELNMSLSMVLGLVAGLTGIVMWFALGLKKSFAGRGIFVAAH